MGHTVISDTGGGVTGLHPMQAWAASWLRSAGVHTSRALGHQVETLGRWEIRGRGGRGCGSD